MYFGPVPEFLLVNSAATRFSMAVGFEGEIFIQLSLFADAFVKCRKHSPAARVFYFSLMFSNARRVLSQCNTRLRPLYLLNIYIYIYIYLTSILRGRAGYEMIYNQRGA